MPAWAMISVAPGYRSTSARRPSAIGGRPRVGGGESLRARVQLDPARPGIEAAAGLVERRFVQVEAHEGDQAALASLGERERAVVRRREAWMTVVLVEAEHEGARDAVLRHQRFQLVVVADHAVDVVAEVEVRVEDVGAVGKQLAELGVVTVDQR
jgi:hypothetical protein